MQVTGLMITCVLGMCIVYAISKKFTLLEAIGFSFMTGIGVQTFVMFILNANGHTFTIDLILKISGGIIAVLLLFIFFFHKVYAFRISFKQIKAYFRNKPFGKINLLAHTQR